MRAAWPPDLTFREAILRAAAIALILLLAVCGWIGFNLMRAANYGFGPEWNCEALATNAALNCVKREPATKPAR